MTFQYFNSSFKAESSSQKKRKAQFPQLFSSKPKKLKSGGMNPKNACAALNEYKPGLEYKLLEMKGVGYKNYLQFLIIGIVMLTCQNKMFEKQSSYSMIVSKWQKVGRYLNICFTKNFCCDFFTQCEINVGHLITQIAFVRVLVLRLDCFCSK